MPKLSPAVTVSVLKALKPGEEVADGGCPGLRARGRDGRVVWSVMVRDGSGVRKRIDIGDWPAIGVPEARALAAKAKAEAALPPPPKPVDLLTLEALIDLYGELGEPPEKTWPDIQRRTKLVFAPVLRQPVASPEELQKVADAYPSRGQASVAVRYIKPILKWGSKRGYAPKGVGLELEQPVRTKKRERVLSEAELMALLPQLGHKHHDGAIRMMLLTACRREEVVGMTFEEIIEDVWHIPGDRRKGGKPHDVPLSIDAQTLIGAQGRTSGFVFLGERGKPLVNWDRYQQKLFERTGTKDWHRHDLRRTAATLLGHAGVAPFIIEVVLGHKMIGGNAMGTNMPTVNPQLAGVYNQSRYAQLHEEALKLLSDILSGLEIKGRSVVTR